MMSFRRFFTLLACAWHIVAREALFGDSYLASSVDRRVKAPDFLLRAQVTDINGKAVDPALFLSGVTLITNVASEAANTETEYRELAELDAELRPRGLRVLAFPCNQFGGAEPHSHDEIRQVAAGYGAHFAISQRVEVNGPYTDRFYRMLKGKGAEEIKSNFYSKFLVKCADDFCMVRRYDDQSPWRLRSVVISLLSIEGLPEQYSSEL